MAGLPANCYTLLYFFYFFSDMIIHRNTKRHVNSGMASCRNHRYSTKRLTASCSHLALLTAAHVSERLTIWLQSGQCSLSFALIGNGQSIRRPPCRASCRILLAEIRLDAPLRRSVRDRLSAVRRAGRSVGQREPFHSIWLARPAWALLRSAGE